MTESYYSNTRFHIMGVDRLNQLVVKIKRTQVFITLRAESVQWRKLTSIGSTEFWYELLRLEDRQTPAGKPLHPKRFIDEICENMFDIGIKKGLFRPLDLRGYGAWREKGKNIVFNLGDRLLLNGQVSKELDDDDLEHRYVGGKALSFSDEFASKRELIDWVKALREVRFDSRHSHRCVVGWLVISILGGALDWRPHLWLVGPSGAGKSWVLENVCKALLGDYLCVTNNVSEAGLSRKVGNASLPICVDEAEAGTVEHIFIAMRNASTGFGSRIRAAPSGGSETDEFLLRSSFFVSSITVPELSQRDACLLYTSPSPRDRQKSRMPSSA